MANQTICKETKFAVGDTIRVHQKIKEGDKFRTQIFEGIVIAINGIVDGYSFTVRKISAGNIGVEKIWSTKSPWIEKISVVKKGYVRRAKLYYLRDRKGKEATAIRAKKEKPQK